MNKSPRDIEIVQDGHPVLREVASSVPIEKIKDLKIQRVVERMKAALDSQDDGVAIAAPQIGESLRIFVVSEKAVGGKGHDVYINPEITKISKDRKALEEGCLSVRWLYGKTKRASRVSIRAYNQNGELFEKNGVGLLAQIFQHETDHLDGILFIDHASNIHSMPDDEIPDSSK